jgi:hypothetical protein
VRRRQERGAHRVGIGGGVAPEVHTDHLANLSDVIVVLRLSRPGEGQRGQGSEKRE